MSFRGTGLVHICFGNSSESLKKVLSSQANLSGTARQTACTALQEPTPTLSDTGVPKGRATVGGLGTALDGSRLKSATCPCSVLSSCSAH